MEIINFKQMKKIFLILLTAIILIGCASSEQKATNDPPPELQEKSDPAPKEGEILPDPIFYPMPPNQPRLQFLTTITNKDKAEPGDFPLTPRSFLKIYRPFDMGAVNGKIYISDRKFQKVLIVDLETKKLDSIAGPYQSAGIWVTEDDYKYIADFNKKQVVVFDSNNKITKVYSGSELFDKPTDVTVFEDRVYVCDLNRHHILVLDKASGESIKEIGGIGTEEGKFYKPTHVIVDREGNLYVNDFFNLRVQKFDTDGNFLKSFGQPGDTLGSFARPKGISIDRDGHLYAVDAAFENVQIFDDRTTDLLLFFGSFGMEPGDMYLPNGIYIDYNNIEYFKKYADKNFDLQYLVYVGNTWGPIRFNVYGFGSWTGPPLTEDKQDTGESNETTE